MANFVGLAAGVQHLGAQRGVDVSSDGIAALGAVRVLTGEAHACVPKACALLGLGRSAVETIPCEFGRERVDVRSLEQRLVSLTGDPVIIVGNAGTVTTGDFDDLDALADLAEHYGAYFHVDAASGLFAAASPDLQHLVSGIERADTIAGDAHKWLNVPHDSGFLFSRHLEAQLQMFKNLSNYLPPPTADPCNVPNLGPENTRRVRALPAWVTLEAYGRDGYRELLERSCAFARRIGDVVDKEPGFRLRAAVRFNVVCFEIIDAAGPAGTDATNDLVRELIADGRVRVNASVFEGRACIRLAILNWRTEENDLEIAVEAMRRCRRKIGK